MRFTETVWAQAAPLRAAMRTMPFNAELAAGTLPRETFKHYMLQDAIYLQGYARVLALAAAKAPDGETILEFSKAAETAIVVERALHGGYLAPYGINADDFDSDAASPACEAYVNFMLAQAVTAAFPTLVAAILPCFWVYREVGLHVAGIAARDNFYQAWIDTYSDDSFAAATDRMIAICDRAADQAGSLERTRMSKAFLRCCAHEYRFWDAAYRRETWSLPTPV